MEEKQILDRVKDLLGITDNTQDNKIKEYIFLFCEKVKSECNRIDFPKELDYQAVLYAKNCYLYYKNKDNLSNEQKQVTNVSDNGQSVSFQIKEFITKDDVDINKVVNRLSNELAKYTYMKEV